MTNFHNTSLIGLRLYLSNIPHSGQTSAFLFCLCFHLQCSVVRSTQSVLNAYCFSFPFHCINKLIPPTGASRLGLLEMSSVQTDGWADHGFRCFQIAQLPLINTGFLPTSCCNHMPLTVYSFKTGSFRKFLLNMLIMFFFRMLLELQTFLFTQRSSCVVEIPEIS